MIIEINDATTIDEIAKSVEASFPNLRMAFFKEPHGRGEESDMSAYIPAHKTIGQVKTTHNTGAMEIHGWHKTGPVEKEFFKLFGLNVQVLRRLGNNWVQTSLSDNLSLEEQHEAAGNYTQDLLYGGDLKKEKDQE
jgi:hypothetical protein